MNVVQLHTPSPPHLPIQSQNTTTVMLYIFFVFDKLKLFVVIYLIYTDIYTAS